MQSADLTVTSEEKILDAVLMWCMKAEEPQRWEDIDELMNYSNPETLFKERLQSLDDLLPHVRFSLLPYELLERVKQIPTLLILVRVLSFSVKFILMSSMVNDLAVRKQQLKQTNPSIQSSCKFLTLSFLFLLSRLFFCSRLLIFCVVYR